MEQNLTIHFVAADARLRAELACTAAALGFDVQLYSSVDWLFTRSPDEGVVIVTQCAIAEGTAAFMERMGRERRWLPLLLASEQPRVDDIVDAIKGGALDYLRLPISCEKLGPVIERVRQEAIHRSLARRKSVEARRIVSSLSKREREVLNLVAEGNSNKAIARVLQISPRTVEIYRAKMKEKLGAGHTAAAVRLRLEADLDELMPIPVRFIRVQPVDLTLN